MPSAYRWLFNYLTAHAELDDYSPLMVAPLTMAESFLRLIRREQEHAQAGQPAHIVAKMNSLLEPSIIKALYQASQAGVEIDLIVRGLSILRPGVKGLSERIRVRSIVGRFLDRVVGRLYQPRRIEVGYRVGAAIRLSRTVRVEAEDEPEVVSRVRVSPHLRAAHCLVNSAAVSRRPVRGNCECGQRLYPHRGLRVT